MNSASSKERTFAIGDVHGCAAELEALLDRLRTKSSDTVVFLGDYVDRGPSAKRVIDLILDLSKVCRVVALKGNHEAMFLDFLNHPESVGAGLFILNGGAATLASYSSGDGSFEIPESHIEFLQNLKLTHETETHFFVHAGVPLEPLAKLNAKDQEQHLLWSRHPFLSTDFKWEKMIVHGHTPAPEPERRPNRINIDTGCVYGGSLTAIELPAGRLHSVARGTRVAVPLYPIDEIKTGLEGRQRIALRFTGRLPVEAKRKGDDLRHFETLNFNQFGLLMSERSGKPGEASLDTGDMIEGRIGHSDSAIPFKGEVVRVETRGEAMYYGVRIDKISNGNGGREWISRPVVVDAKAGNGNMT